MWDTRHNRKVFFDGLVFKPFTSVVVFITGRDQTVGDPNPFPQEQGLVNLAIEEYRESGRDVYLYEHTDVDYGMGGGPIYDMVVSAINDRGVVHVASMGYSWGGGATHDLVGRLRQNQTGELSDIVAPFDVPFTGYIDGIKHNSSIDARSEDRRPPISLFHCAQYETNSWPSAHGTPSDGDDDLNRSNLGVVHLTIDDNLDVLGLLQSRLRQKVQP